MIFFWEKYCSLAEKVRLISQANMVHAVMPFPAFDAASYVIQRFFIDVFQFLTFKMWRIKCYHKSQSIGLIQAKEAYRNEYTSFRKIKACGIILDFLLSTSFLKRGISPFSLIATEIPVLQSISERWKKFAEDSRNYPEKNNMYTTWSENYATLYCVNC